MKILRSLALLAVAAITVAACSTTKTGGNPTPTARSAPPASRTFPAEGVTTQPTPKVTVAHYKVGQTADLAVVEVPAGQTGATAPRLAVDPSRPTAGRVQLARIRFSRGDEFDRPERGYYLGVYVKRQVVHDPYDLGWNLYALVNGHHYDATFAASGFDPALDESVNLNDGETSEGWMVFDVPARHGELVMVDAFSNDKIAVWSF